MQIFVVNLARRSDRLEAMASRLGRLGLGFTRVPALDAREVSDDLLAARFTHRGPLGVLPKGDQCCSLSHRRAWSALVASGAPFGAVLEDDVELTAAAAEYLRDSRWIPQGVDLVKLEHFGPSHQRILAGEPKSVTGGRSIAPILSRYAGAAAYVLSRQTALELLALERWTVPVDHLLFNPNVSPLAAKLNPYQLLPAVARQMDARKQPSDIVPWRLPQRAFSVELVRRELVRAAYELKLLPQQLGAALLGRAKLVAVTEAYPNEKRTEPGWQLGRRAA